MLELMTPIKITGKSKAKAVSLPETTDVNFSPGTNFTVSGWGALCERCNSPSKLHHVTVPFVSDSDCGKAYDLTPSMLCAGNIEDGGIDSCQGDSGGKNTNIFTITYQYILLLCVVIE